MDMYKILRFLHHRRHLNLQQIHKGMDHLDLVIPYPHLRRRQMSQMGLEFLRHQFYRYLALAVAQCKGLLHHLVADRRVRHHHLLH
jgi:hypothetical protein